MKYKWLFLLILIILTAWVSGCEKYTLNKIYGFYTLKSYTVDGIDSLSLYKDSLGTDFHFYYNDTYNHNECLNTGIRTDGQNTILVCKWELINNEKILKIITSYGPIGTGPFGNNITPEWHLFNLTKKEIEMSTNYNDKEYIVNLNRL